MNLNLSLLSTNHLPTLSFLPVSRIDITALCARSKNRTCAYTGVDGPKVYVAGFLLRERALLGVTLTPRPTGYLRVPLLRVEGI